MTATRLAVILGVALLGFLCWLAAIGFTAVVAPLVTVFVLLLLIAGGNWLGDRGSARGSGGAR